MPETTSACGRPMGTDPITGALVCIHCMAKEGEACKAPETTAVDPQACVDRLIDAAENVIIAYGMGWDMDGMIERLKEALPPDSVCRRNP